MALRVDRQRPVAVLKKQPLAPTPKPQRTAARDEMSTGKGSALRARAKKELELGNYNVGRGNTDGHYNDGKPWREAKGDGVKKVEPDPKIQDGARYHIAESARLVAKEMLGGLDVVTLQEMSKQKGKSEASKNPDYNVLMLGSVFRESLGADWKDAELSWKKSATGIQVTATNPDGTTKSTELRVEELNEKGRAHTGDRPPAVTVYSMKLPDGRDYTMVFGASDVAKDGNYGNSVLLGPGRSLPRLADGSIDPKAVELISLGNDADKKQPDGTMKKGQNRSALSLSVLDANGEKVRLVSTHLTVGGSDAAQQAREQELARLEKLAKHNAGTPVVIGGDFNTDPETALRKAKPVEDDEPGIDHVLTNDRAHAKGRSDRVVGGGSDHLLIKTTAIIDG